MIAGSVVSLSPTFLETLKQRNVAPPTDGLGRRLLAEYGGMFVARGVTLPPVYRFASAADIERFQESAHPTAVTLGKTRIELQPAAAKALQSALEEARGAGLSLHARGGASAARRSLGDAVEFWNKRVENGLAHWTKVGKMTGARAAAIRAMPLAANIEAVLEEEDRGHWFALSLDKTIMRSTAPPGSSQHHSMLALDVAEHANAKVRALLARHGWFQTVLSDQPHFTYLGVREDELSALGLERVEAEGRVWWIPAR